MPNFQLFKDTIIGRFLIIDLYLEGLLIFKLLNLQTIEDLLSIY
jgi:hypothetical protein